MHNQQDFLQQLRREKALHRYISAFEHDDLDVMSEVLEQAMTDPKLEEMIMEAHDYFQEEDMFTLREEDAARIVDLVAQHLPSAIPDDAIDIPALTVSDVLISLLENPTAHRMLKQEAQKMYAKVSASPLSLPEKLGLTEISQLFALLNVQVSAKFQKEFRDKAIILSMSRQQGIARLAAARRQKTKLQHKEKPGGDMHL